MNQTLHIFQSSLAYSEKCPRTPSLSTIYLLEETFSHIVSWSRAQSQDQIRPVSQCPSCDRRDEPAPTARLPVQLTIVDKNRSRLLEISTIETCHGINDQQAWSL